jgi:YD repeat-containing protein
VFPYPDAPPFARFIIVVAFAALSFRTAAIAQQITDVTSKTATPIPGVGHDYLHDMNEIVSPANGSLSIRIAAPTPHERGMNFPIFAYTYDSNGQFTLVMVPTPVGCGGAIYQCTSVNVLGPTLQQPNLWPSFPGAVSSQNISLNFNEGIDHNPYTCQYVGNYVYVDLEGGRHTLSLQTNLVSSGGGAGCPFFGVSAQNYGGDLEYKAGAGIPNAPNGTVDVIDSHGNFLGGGITGGEDTNGNYRNGTGRSWSVTYGTGAQLYSPLSMTVPGYSVPYTYTYAAAPASFTGLNSTLVSSVSNGTCSGPGAGGAGSTYALQQLNLPNGQNYQFGYDPVYGLVNSITYPTGATVSYTWGLNTQSEMTAYIENNSIGSSVATPSTCYFIHDWPAIQTRVVSFVAGTPALEQDFSYTNTWSSGGSNPYGLPAGAQWWTSKTTTVTTKDRLRPGTPSYKTIYTYIPYLVYPQDPTSTAAPSELPLESQIVYQDITGSVLRTVTKVWNSPNQLAAECTTLPNNQTSGKFYTYEPFVWSSTQQGQLGPGVGNSTTDQVTDLKEFDYGSVTTPCQNPGTTPTRETKTTYASLGNPQYWPSGQYMSDRPSQVQVYGPLGTLISQTNYSYDQAAVTAATQQPIYGHDTVYSASAASQPRGNVTTITKQCFTSGGPCQNSIMTLTYDETGQVLSVTDSLHNTTSLSYNDSYTNGDPPTGYHTNAYLTTITPPTTNGISHTSTYMYDYEKGELSVATDENSQATNYSYNDPWDRLTAANYPDGGQKSYSYVDAGPNPSVTASTLLNSGGTTETSTKIMDGVGHVLYELTSDPNGADAVQTAIDGNGRVWTKSNPFRGCPALANPYPGCTPPANTTTTNYYDALGRPIETSEQDGSTLQWCYDGAASSLAVYCNSHLGSVLTGTWVDSTDERSNHWQRTSDAFGRLTEVMEPSGSSQSAAMETDYLYNALNDLLSVKQCGALCSSPASNGPIVRSFQYDSLSRLYSAANPETGVVSYIYDANSNLLSKIDARGVKTSYQYDALNRVLSKTYTGDASYTPLSCYQYDSSSATCSQPKSNLIGRPTNSWTQSASTTSSCSTSASFLTKRSIACYDAMGRVTQERQFTPASQASGTLYAPVYTYDLAGDLTSSTDGVTPIPSQGSWSSPCPSAPTPGTMLTFVNCYDTAGHLQSVTSNWNDGTHLPLLFNTTPSTTSPSYTPFGALQNATFSNGGLISGRKYDIRMRITGETDTGNGSQPATAGNATVTITGSEQSN